MERKRFIFTEEVIIDAEPGKFPTDRELLGACSLVIAQRTSSPWEPVGLYSARNVEEVKPGQTKDEQITSLQRQLAEAKQSKIVYRTRFADTRDKDGKCIDCAGWGQPAGCQNCGMTAMGG